MFLPHLHNPDDKDEKEKQAKFFGSRRDDPKKHNWNQDYPHACTVCGRSAFVSFSRPYCTNPNCKWYDRERLEVKTSYDPSTKSATVTPVAADDYMDRVPFGD